MFRDLEVEDRRDEHLVGSQVTAVSQLLCPEAIEAGVGFSRKKQQGVIAGNGYIDSGIVLGAVCCHPR